MNRFSWFVLMLLSLLPGCSADPTGADARTYPCAQENECTPGFTCRAGVCQSANGNETEESGSPTQLGFSTAAQVVETGQCSAPVVLETREAGGGAAAVTSDTTVALRAQPATKVNFFLDAACTVPITSVTVGAGNSRAAFYFQGGVAQTVRIGATAPGLTAASQDAVLALTLNLFDGGNPNNWAMRIGSAAIGWGSSAVNQGTSNPTMVTGISATPVEYNATPWGAIHAVFKSEAQLFIQTKSVNSDLSTYRNAPGNLIFEVKVDAAPQGNATLALFCAASGCRTDLMLAPLLHSLVGKGWSRLSIPLDCFSGMNFKSVFAPFLIYSSSPMDLTLAHIRWGTGSAPNVSCADLVPARVSQVE